MFGVLNNLDTKNWEEYEESFYKTEPSEIKTKDVETILKENGMKG